MKLALFKEIRCKIQTLIIAVLSRGYQIFPSQEVQSFHVLRKRRTASRMTRLVPVGYTDLLKAD